jgi:oligosaccharyltransferase complex subunit alpha (ribophorin I)
VAPFTVEELKVHFENNSPFAVVEQLEREIEVSHWGNVYVTEHYKMRNAGAKHKGTFSRFEYQARPGVSGQNAVRELLARLPPRAYSVYYRDEIGNISSSHVRSTRLLTEVQLEPRYPLLGGWKTEFTVGYSLPLADFLFRTKDGRRRLNITFGCPLRDVVVEDLTLKVILPEGSTDLAAEVPFPVAQSRDVRYTYLDTVGRPVLVLQKQNVVMEHNQHFQVSYRFGPLALLSEPLLLVAFFLLLVVASILALRLDFTLAKNSAAYQADLHRDKVRDLLVRLASVVAARSAEGDKVEAALKELSRSGDVGAARAARKAVESSLKDSARQLKALQDELEAAGDAKAAAKANAVVAKEREKVAAQAQLHETAVAVWEKKLTAKDGEQRMVGLHQRIKGLKQEVRDLIQALEE